MLRIIKTMNNIGVSISIILLVIILIIAVAIYVTGCSKKESFVVPDSGSSDELVDFGTVSDLDNDNLLMVKVYANWCKHCNNMSNEWYNFYKKNNGLKIGSKNVKIVSLEEGNKLTKQVFDTIKYKTRGYPTILKISRSGEEYSVSECTGPRTISNWEQFAAK